MSALRKPARLTAADYLAYDASHPGKHEFWNGRIVAMAGASPNHNKLTRPVRVLARLSAADDRGCDGFTSDQRVDVPSGNYAYPDLVVACDPEYDGTHKPITLLNPLLIVEIMSPSTQHIDRSRKLRAYTQIPSLQAYWLFEQDERAATLFERVGDLWSIRGVSGEDGVIESSLFERTFSMGELYKRLDLDDSPSLPGGDTSPEADA